MARNDFAALSQLLQKHQKALLAEWMEMQGRGAGPDQAELAARFLEALRAPLSQGAPAELSSPQWAQARDVLERVSQSRATLGSTPTETATFVFSLKGPLFELIRRELADEQGRVPAEMLTASLLLDRLGLFTTEIAQKARDEMIVRQQQDLLELSTPVVQLWDGILALPLIGTLNSERTQVVMESLLEEIVKTRAEIAIIDITGVPTVDTLVAQHLIKTVSAARLMGADCIISGIRPQIAQTIVHLGLDLNVTSKATMADAFALALRRTGRSLHKSNPAANGA